MWRIVITCLLFLGYFAFANCGNENSEKKDGGLSCGSKLTQQTGQFEVYSFDFKGDCVLQISPPPINKTTATISLFLSTIFLHDDDVLTLFKNLVDVNNDSLSIIKPLRGAQNGSVTIYTKESQLVIKLKGNPKAAYQRKFKGTYHSRVCAFEIPPDVKIINSPIHADLIVSVDCIFTYRKDPLSRSTLSFIFEEFDMHSSSVSLAHSTIDGPYKHVTPIDFFPLKNKLVLDVKMQVSSTDSFRLLLRQVDSSCYQHFKFANEKKFTVESPPNMLINSSIDLTECRWIFEHTDPTKIMGVTFDKLHFNDAMDIIAINDGASELSPPLIHVTALSGKNQMIRSSGPFLWMSFRPSANTSMVAATVSAHGQGGYHKGSGNISVTLGNSDDPVFLLEVEEGKIVLLKFEDSDIPLPATLNIYDGFDKTNLLATLHGDIWYPILSKSNKMMLITSNFANGKFEAKFEGVSASCLHMSTFSDVNYILSGNYNTTCLWIVPPRDEPNSNLLLSIEFLALAKGDELKILRLDAAKTELGEISSGTSHVPQLMIPANIGALVEITRAPCTEDSEDVVLVGHSSYLPSCGRDMFLASQDSFQISSPHYPDTYPVFAACRWKISTAKDNLVHLAFHYLKLAPNHCVTITYSHGNKAEIYEENDLREDLFVTGESFIEFDSTNCKHSEDSLPLVSSEGFELNGTVSDCGSVLIGKANGTFSVPADKLLCFWKISIPQTAHNSSNVNVISYTVSENDEKGNYELQVYDGNTVRDKKIANSNSSKIWSRTSDLIFVYKRIDASKPSSILTITFDTINCTMLCDNRVCMHPDWRCNGINDCRDFSDERNCDTVSQYSSSEVTGAIVGTLVLGAVLGVGVQFCVKRIIFRYRNRQYEELITI